MPQGRANLNRILAAGVAALAFGLIGGVRADSIWAGGAGAESAAVTVARVEGSPEAERDGVRRLLAAGDVLRRGEFVRTDAGETVELVVGSDRLALDERSDVELISLASADVVIGFTRGRLLFTHDKTVPHRATVRTNATDTIILGGDVSLVNYDWLETVSVIPFETAVSVFANGHGWLLRAPADIHETEPVGLVDVAFDPAASAAAGFYAWATEGRPPLETSE